MQDLLDRPRMAAALAKASPLPRKRLVLTVPIDLPATGFDPSRTSGSGPVAVDSAFWIGGVEAEARRPAIRSSLRYVFIAGGAAGLAWSLPHLAVRATTASSSESVVAWSTTTIFGLLAFIAPTALGHLIARSLGRTSTLVYALLGLALSVVAAPLALSPNLAGVIAAAVPSVFAMLLYRRLAGVELVVGR